MRSRLLATVVLSSLSLAGGASAQDLVFAIEAGPNPAALSEPLDVAVTVSNRGDTIEEDVSVEIALPASGIQPFSRSLAGSDATGCTSIDNNSSCAPGETVAWTLQLAPGEGATFRIPPLVVTSAASLPNEPLAFVARILADDVPVGLPLEASVVVESDPIKDLPALKLEISEDRDPVTPESAITYTLAFGHRAPQRFATNARLELPIPAGADFVSATGTHAIVGNVVRWELGRLASGQNGVRQATFTLRDPEAVGDPGPSTGELIVAEATISDTGDENNVPGEAHARSITRVRGDTQLSLAMEVNPDPVQRSEPFDVGLTVSNRGATTLTGVLVTLVLPDHLSGISSDLIEVFADGCVGGIANSTSCDSRERVTFGPITLAAGAGRTFRLPPVVSNAERTRGGTVIEFDAWARAPGEFAEASHAANIEFDPIKDVPALKLEISEDRDPVAPESAITYTLAYGHRAPLRSATNARLELPIPAGTDFTAATGTYVLEGNLVRWNLGTLASGDSGVRQATFTLRDTDAIDDPGPVAGEFLVAAATLRDEGDTSNAAGEARAESITRVRASTNLLLAMELGPDPVQKGESMDVGVTVSNRSATTMTNVFVTVVLPDHLGGFSDDLVAPLAAGSCVGGVSNSSACDSRERVIWGPITLAGGGGRTLRLPPAAATALRTVDGTVIEFDAFASTADEFTEASRTASIVTARTLEFGIRESSDPVAPSGVLEYTIAFGSDGQPLPALIETADLWLRIPPGFQLESVSHGGEKVGPFVRWISLRVKPGVLGVAEPRTVRVRPPLGLTNGTLIAAEAELIERTAPRRTIRASAVTRLRANPPITVELVYPDMPAERGWAYVVQARVSNATPFTSGTIQVQGIMPLGVQPIAEGGVFTGQCAGGSCEPGERVTWTIAPLAAGGETALVVPFGIAASGSDGRMLQLQLTARELTSLEEAEAGFVKPIPEPGATLLAIAVLTSLAALNLRRRRAARRRAWTLRSWVYTHQTQPRN